MTQRFYIGQKVRVYGKQSAIVFDGQIGRICFYNGESTYDYSIDFKGYFENINLHTCFKYQRPGKDPRKFELPERTGYNFQSNRVTIIPYCSDTFEEDGEE